MLDFVAILAAQDRTRRISHEARPDAPVQLDAAPAPGGWRQPFQRLRAHLAQRSAPRPAGAKPGGCDAAAHSA